MEVVNMFGFLWMRGCVGVYNGNLFGSFQEKKSFELEFKEWNKSYFVFLELEKFLIWNLLFR